jgi:hypothetical protein
MPQEKSSNLLVCPDCAGAGVIGWKKCKNCCGLGIGQFSGSHFLYWGGIKSAADVFVARISRILNKIIDGCLLLFGLAGFIDLALYG